MDGRNCAAKWRDSHVLVGADAGRSVGLSCRARECSRCRCRGSANCASGAVSPHGDDVRIAVVVTSVHHSPDLSNDQQTAARRAGCDIAAARHSRGAPRGRTIHCESNREGADVTLVAHLPAWRPARLRARRRNQRRCCGRTRGSPPGGSCTRLDART